MISRITALMVALFLLFSCIGENKSVEEKLCEEIYDYAVAINDINSTCMSALDFWIYLEEYPDYRIIQNYRLLIEEAIREFEKYEKEINSLSADEYLDLLLDGVDVDEIIMMYESMNSYYAIVIQDMKILLNYMYTDIWFEPYYNYIMESASFLSGFMLQNQQIQCYTLNYVLMQIQDQKLAEKTWDRIFADCMCLSNQSMSRYKYDPQVLPEMIRVEEEQAGSDYDDVQVRLREYLEYAEFVLQEYEKGDTAAKKYIRHFERENEWYPLDDWMRTETAEYTIISSSEHAKEYQMWRWMFGPGDTDTVTVFYPEITRERVFSYAERARGLGYHVSVEFSRNENREAIKLSLFTDTDAAGIIITWTETEAILHLPVQGVSLVPFSYIALEQLG